MSVQRHSMIGEIHRAEISLDIWCTPVTIIDDDEDDVPTTVNSEK